VTFDNKGSKRTTRNVKNKIARCFKLLKVMLTLLWI